MLHLVYTLPRKDTAIPIKPTILCVDDEAIVRDSLREQIRRQFASDFRVETAGDGEEALEVLEECQEDGIEVPAIVSDHIMPGMKGDELLIEVHQRLPRTRKILLTGQAGAEAVGRAVNEAGLYRYISKPWDREDLALTLREAIRSYQQEQAVELHQNKLMAAHQASTRFVPFEFLQLLGRDRLEEVSREDHVEKELSVYFSDIRGFTRLVEGRSPEQNFAFINEYLSYMEPAIRAEQGFVDSYEGDAIMALFPGAADTAVRAGIASLKALAHYNSARTGRGEAPIRIGIGVNTGSVMLGIMGGTERIKAGVIGDPVNLAARVEGLTRLAGASFLITQETKEKLQNPDAYALRFVDRVVVKGRKQPSSVFEVLDGLPEEERTRKLASRDRLAEAAELFRAGRLEEADRLFHELVATDPSDTLLHEYLARCDSYLQHGYPTNWDGAVKLERK